MGKRSNFERNAKDFYPTPYEAILPLLPHLPAQSHFIEPCAGDGRLIRHLQKHGHICDFACDIEPVQDEHSSFQITQADVLFFGYQLPQTEFIITNPPWSRESLHEMIDKFRYHAPTWLLFDADWMFTKQSEDYKRYCQKIVTVGRVSWMDNGTSGMDNCCWYLFGPELCDTIFI